MTKSVVRYSDEDLQEFKALIERKLARTKEQIESLQGQIYEITENTSDEHGGDWVDDSSTSSDIEMLNRMAIRQRSYLRDLQNALLRIRNKTYGICSVTNELIDKRRLLAVPTTTKRMEVKVGKAASRSTRRSLTAEEESKRKEKKNEKKIITRVIKKSTSNTKEKALAFDEEDELDEFETDVSFLAENDEDIIKDSIGEFEELPDDDQLIDKSGIEEED